MEGITPGLIQLLYRHLRGETEENRKVPEVRLAAVPAENRTEQFPNTSPECYRCANLLALMTVLSCAGQRPFKRRVCWDVMPCSPVEVHGRFGDTYSIFSLVACSSTTQNGRTFLRHINEAPDCTASDQRR
jgi:hypothetical protein